MQTTGGRPIDFNSDKVVRPIEAATLAGGLIFSHGHFIVNAGYSASFDNIFNWEEPY